VADFTLNITTPTGAYSTPTVLPGGTLTYPMTVEPTRGSTFPSAVTFSASGLPAGAAATFSPASLSAGSSSTNVSLSILFAQQVASRDFPRPLGRRFALAMLGGIFLLPFGRRLGRSRQRAGRFAGLLLLTLALGSVLGLVACGATRSGYFAQQPQTFTATITASSGGLSHTATITFTLE